MSKKQFLIGATIALSLLIGLFVFAKRSSDDDRFIIYKADPKKQEIRFYWQDEKHTNFSSIEHLKTWLARNHQQLILL